MNDIRFNPRFRMMSIWESIGYWIWTGKWIRVEVSYDVLYPNDSGYDKAPFSCDIIQTENVMKIEMKK